MVEVWFCISGRSLLGLQTVSSERREPSFDSIQEAVDSMGDHDGSLDEFMLSGEMSDRTTLRTPLLDNTANEIKALIDNQPSIRVIRVNDFGISRENMYLIVSALTTKTNLKRLEIASCDTVFDVRVMVINLAPHKPYHAQQFATDLHVAMTKNKLLESVSLVNLHIDNQTAVAIISGIRDNRNLIELNLRGGIITDFGIKNIADTIAGHSSLEILDLGKNRINDEGAKCIAGIIERNSCLHKIHLDDNYIGDEGAIAIANSLKENISVKELTMQRNSADLDKVVPLFSEIVKENKSLKLLILYVEPDNIYSNRLTFQTENLLQQMDQVLVTNRNNYSRWSIVAALSGWRDLDITKNSDIFDMNCVRMILEFADLSRDTDSGPYECMSGN